MKTLTVPTLITVGDHDECGQSIAKDMSALIPGSKLAVLPQSGHMTFVDQPEPFVSAVGEFIHPSEELGICAGCRRAGFRGHPAFGLQSTRADKLARPQRARPTASRFRIAGSIKSLPISQPTGPDHSGLVFVI